MAPRVSLTEKSKPFMRLDVSRKSPLPPDEPCSHAGCGAQGQCWVRRRRLLRSHLEIKSLSDGSQHKGHLDRCQCSPCAVTRTASEGKVGEFRRRMGASSVPAVGIEFQWVGKPLGVSANKPLIQNNRGPLRKLEVCHRKRSDRLASNYVGLRVQPHRFLQDTLRVFQ